MTDRNDRKRPPFAELRARQQLAVRALEDARVLLAEADPIGAPADFAERERKALAILDEVSELVPMKEPLSPEERARLERELEDKPDDETLRAMLIEMEKLLDDPRVPEELKSQISREQILEARRSMDEVALFKPLAQAAQAVLEEARARSTLGPPDKRDPGTIAVRAARQEAERNAAKRRS